MGDVRGAATSGPRTPRAAGTATGRLHRCKTGASRGEIFALLGPIGAGKTTLIRMITDILKPDAGTIRLDGHDVASGSRAGIAYLPEERGLYRRIKAVETLAYYGELKGLRPAAAR